MTRIAKSDREEFMATARRHLLNAALVEFANHGFDLANINTISQAAGFAKGTVYNYFTSKEALMLALIAETGADHVASVRGAVRQVSDPVQRLLQFYEAGFTYVAEHPSEAHFLITTLYSPQLQFREAMRRAYLPMFQLVAEEILQPGFSSGLFRKENPMALASLLMTIYLGTSSTVDEQGRPYMDAHRVADFVLRSLSESPASQEEK